MSGSSVNYDQVAPTYNRRFRSQKDRPIAAALIELARAFRARRILETGCGTGRWLADLLAQQAISPEGLFGLDRSAGMLAQADQQPEKLQIVQGLAEMLPFPGEFFDLIYCVNALHHFSQPGQFIRQAFRLLRPGGCLAVIGMDPHNFLERTGQPARARWYVYEYFEGTLATDLLRFPTWGQVLDWMTAAGFQTAQLQPVEWVRDTKVGPAVWSDPFLEKHSTSQLILLTDEAYQAGLDRIRDALVDAESTGQTVHFPVDLLIDRMVAQKLDE